VIHWLVAAVTDIFQLGFHIILVGLRLVVLLQGHHSEAREASDVQE
jgi:hypothetical protein